jgi:hypothetical protein
MPKRELFRTIRQYERFANRPYHWPMAIPVANKTSYSHLFTTGIDLRRVRLSDKYRTSRNYFDILDYFLDFGGLILVMPK